MSKDQVPSWLANVDDDVESQAPKPPKSNAVNPPQPANSAPQQQPVNESGQNEPKYKKYFTYLVLVGNVFFSVLTSATGALGIGTANSINDTAAVFVGLYMILLAGILVTYEVSQLSRFVWLDNIVKKNFGFLYGPFGRSIFIIFMAFLAFGITSPRSLAIATGTLVGLWGVFQFAIAFAYPDYYDKKAKYIPQM